LGALFSLADIGHKLGRKLSPTRRKIFTDVPAPIYAVHGICPPHMGTIRAMSVSESHASRLPSRRRHLRARANSENSPEMLTFPKIAF
jgi:hypothetical protein